MVCYTWWNYVFLIPYPRYDAEGLVPNSEITTLTLANHQLCRTPCYIQPHGQTVQEWAKLPQLWKDIFWWLYKWVWVHYWKKMRRENPGDRSRQSAKSYRSCLTCMNNINASIVRDIPCYVCFLKACDTNLKQPLQLAHLLQLTNGEWGFGKWGKPVIKCRNQELMSRQLHPFFPGHLLQEGNQHQPGWDVFLLGRILADYARLLQLFN